MLVVLIVVFLFTSHTHYWVTPYPSYVEGLAELVVRNGKDIAQLQEQGNRVRKVAATEMNQRSSRSHSVFTLHIKQRDVDDANDQGLKAKVNLVDLAGSERADATGAQGLTLKEGAAINKRYRITLEYGRGWMDTGPGVYMG